MNYWQVDVKLTMEHESGKIQKVTENQLKDIVLTSNIPTNLNKKLSTSTSFKNRITQDLPLPILLNR